MPKKVRPFKVANKDLPYSPVVQIGNHFHFSGVLPALRSDNVAQCDYAKGQMRDIMAKMFDLLYDCGLTFNDIFHVTIMLSGSMEAYKEVNEVYTEILKEKGVEIMPARKCFAVAGLPFGVLVEVEFEAVKQS